MPYPTGKLPQKDLERLLASSPVRDPRVLVGPGVGRDAAVISFGETCLVAKTDPITFAADEIGWYAVHVNANDVATTGARPAWFLACVLLPEGAADVKMAAGIHADIASACGALGVSLVGGHTEITYGLDRPVVVGQMLGEVPRERLVDGKGAQPGDRILLTKGIAIEGTAILAREKAELFQGEADHALLMHARRFLREPGISVVRGALAAADGPGVRMMHDPTEGGLATGVKELAAAAGLGAAIRLEAVHVYEETAALCRIAGLDALGLIASGALLIVAEEARADEVRRRVEAAGVPCRDIGRMTPPEEGLRAEAPQGETPWPEFERDEIAKMF